MQADQVQVGGWVVARFKPWSMLRHAQVVAVSGEEVVVETMDGQRHSRRAWSLRAAAVCKPGTLIAEAP